MEQRELKFRAWDMFNSVWITDMELYEFPLENNDNGLIYQQYTGLKDKNNVEIYEGDIIRAWVDFGPGGERQIEYEVKIGSFGPNIEEWTYKESDRFLPEVIGNIFERVDIKRTLEENAAKDRDAFEDEDRTFLKKVENIIIKMEPIEDVCIKFTEEQVEQLGLSVGDKFEVKHENGKIVLIPFKKIELDLNDFSRKTLEMLLIESCERGVSVNEVIDDILEDCLNEKDY